MRILVVSQYFWPENFRINDLVKGLVERSHEVTVLTGLPNYPSGKLFEGFGITGPYRGQFGGADLVRVPLIPRGNGRAIRLALNYLSFVLTASLLGSWRCKGHYDAIFVFEPSPITVGIPARVISKVKGAPILFWVQDLWPESLSATGTIRSPRILGAVAGLVRWVYRGCDKVLVQSEAFVQPIRDLGVCVDKIRYFPNSAEALYQTPPTREEWIGPPLPPGFRVMFAGNIGAAQSIETMLAAAEILRGYNDIHWIVLGDGRLAAWLKEEVARRALGDRIHLVGQFPLAAMPAWFAQADLMFASLRRDPAFALTIPSKIQSYLACAKPVVAALDGEGARVVGAAGAGFAVPAEDAASLAKAVLKIYTMDPSERKKLGDNGRNYYEKHFDREKLLDKLEEWLLEVTIR
jgi:colanic acid biosynthesis glycosyl transferase WcaI